MNRRQTISVIQRFSSASTNLSFGFSGAGFLGCYHVGVASCLHRQGLLPNPNDSSASPPFVTGVSAGSMIAAAILAGVNPDPDGMEVVLEAARKTRELTKAHGSNVSLDVLTPGFSLVDQVETPFRAAIIKNLGGTIPDSGQLHGENGNLYDIDPDLFKRRFPDGSLRIGLTDRRVLGPGNILEAYRYVDSYRNVEDIVASCMLSSYIPGGTGPLHLHDKVPGFLTGLFVTNDTSSVNEIKNTAGEHESMNDTVHRAGRRLRHMERDGLVKHGKTGLPIVPEQHKQHSDPTQAVTLNSTDFLDGGIADVFPTFDAQTIIIAPVNGVFHPNPAICPINASEEAELNIIDDQTPTSQLPPLYLQSLMRSYIPKTFKHCHKARLGLNTKNAKAALKMVFSSEDEELYQIFREGYDDAR